ETVTQEPLQSPCLGRRLDDDQTLGHSYSFIPKQPVFFPKAPPWTAGRLLRRAILRPFFGPAQCPYITRLVTAHSAVQLQRGEPAEHLCDRKIQLSGQLGGSDGEHVGHVKKDAVPLRLEPKTEAARGGERVVQDLPSDAEHC